LRHERQYRGDDHHGLPVHTRVKGGSMPEDYELHVGIDWGTQTHHVCFVDQSGQRVGERQIAHSGPGLATLIAELARRVPEPHRIAVALEMPRGALVDVLLAHGCHVFALNPKQLDRFRDRQTVAGAKDDRRDAGVLAEALRTDRGAFRLVQTEDPRLVPLRELSRLHTELVADVTRLTNRLRDQLLRFFPQALALCPAADEPWLWTLLARAPTPAEAQRLRPNALRALLAEHRIRRLTGDALHAALQAPALPVSAATVAAAAEHLSFLVPRVQLSHAQRARCARRLEQLLEALASAEADDAEHRDVTILRSLPGVGRVVAATMLAEAWQPLAARDYQTLRAHAGTAPVTRQSGKTRLVAMRRSCNGRLREAVFHWASNSIRLDQRCRAHYDRLRQRHNHARALRGVADRLLALLITMLASASPYDPLRRQASRT
jgi:transposase